MSLQRIIAQRWFFTLAITRTVHIQFQTYPATLPHSPRHNQSISHNVGRDFLFAVGISLCFVLSATMSQLVPRRYHF
jgi:predicted acyltransferase